MTKLEFIQALKALGNPQEVDTWLQPNTLNVVDVAKIIALRRYVALVCGAAPHHADEIVAKELAHLEMNGEFSFRLFEG